MGAIDGFLSTWSQAHAMFGRGVPGEGAQFDHSSRLLGLRDSVTSARPDSAWTGSASDSYAEANSRQGHSLGSLADLDKRLGVEVDRSAAVVAAGRRDLDAVRKWVVDAAATIPDTALGQRMLYPVIAKGSGEIADIIDRSNGDLAAIAARIRGLGGEYQALGGGEEGAGADPLDVTGDGEEDRDVPQTALDLNDIVYKRPFDPSDSSTYGDPGYKELVPDSGVWVPDPGSRFYRPTPVEKPLDLDDIVQLSPVDSDGNRVLGPSGYMELVPESGTWVPDPNGPMWPTDPPTAPVDLTKIVVADPKALGLPWQMELIPNSGVWVPDPHYGEPS